MSDIQAVIDAAERYRLALVQLQFAANARDAATNAMHEAMRNCSIADENARDAEKALLKLCRP